VLLASSSEVDCHNDYMLAECFNIEVELMNELHSGGD